MLLLMTNLLLAQMLIAIVISRAGTITLHRWCMLQVLIYTFGAQIKLIMILDWCLKLIFLLEALGRHETGNEGLTPTSLRGCLLLLNLPLLFLLL